jgi:hypothetical protein
MFIWIPNLTRGLDGPPGGHANLGRSFPRLKENSLKGVLAVEVFTTSLGPKVVEQEAPEDVEGFTSIGEAARVVAVKVRGVVSFFEDGLPKENKGLGDVEAVGRPPFVPNAEEGTPSLLSRVHSMRQCWADFENPWSQPLQVAGIPMIWSQVPRGSSLLRISQVSAPTLRGRALCHILAMIWATVKSRRLRCWTKVMMLGVCCFLLTFRYPFLVE